MSDSLDFLRDIFHEKLSGKRNDILVESGSVCTDIFFVAKGSVKLTAQIDEKEQIIRFGYKESYMFLPDSFFSEKPTSYQIAFIKSGEVWKCSKEALIKITEENPDTLWQIFSEIILQYADRERDLLTDSAKKRYEHLLKRSPQIFQHIPHRYIASYLRISPETLSRLQKS